MAQHVIERYSRPGGWVLDPFCGFGTMLVIAERLGREPLGFETDARRAAFAASRIANAQRVYPHPRQGRHRRPIAQLCSAADQSSLWQLPNREHDDDPATYLADARRLFSDLTQFLTADTTLAIEVSPVREDGRTRPLVWQLGTVLSEFLASEEDLVRINTAAAEAGPGYDHSHVLVLRHLSESAERLRSA